VTSIPPVLTIGTRVTVVSPGPVNGEAGMIIRTYDDPSTRPYLIQLDTDGARWTFDADDIIGHRTLTIYRERYTVEDDGNGGSEAVETDTDETRHIITGAHYPASDYGPMYHESPAREAVSYLRGEYLSYGADGGDWFGQDEPRTVDYATGEEERVTAHLAGFTATEERAIIRMMGWLDAQDAARVARYTWREHGASI
jgi:hypothetical protein